MKTQLCNKIEIIPIQYISSQTSINITPTEDKYLMSFLTGDSNFQQSGDTQSGNAFVNQSDERNIIGMTVGQMELLFGAKVAVILQTTEGVKCVWGTPDYPVMCEINTYSNGAKLKLSCKSPFPVVF
jgi:hypothetical protein